MEFLKIGGITEKQSITIDTRVLDPQTVSNKQVTFTIQPVGILDRKTRIIIPMKCDSLDSRFPLQSGSNIVETATLRDSLGNTIAQTDQVSLLLSHLNLHKTCERREKVQSVKTANSFVFRNGLADDGDAGQVILKSADFKNTNDAVYRYSDLDTASTAGLTAGKLQTGDTCPRFRSTPKATFETILSLEDLFPELFGSLMLPLHVLKGALSLELLFSDNADRYVMVNGEVDFPNAMIVDTSNVRMVLDLLFYSDETMNSIAAAAADGLPLVYGDFSAITSILTPPALTAMPATSTGADLNGEGSYEFNLGLDNMNVRYLVSSLTQSYTPNTAAYQNYSPSVLSPTVLCNRYCSKAPQDGTGTGLSLNLIVNNSPLYPSDVEFYPRQFIEMKEIHGAPLYVPQATYSFQGSVYDKYAIQCLAGLGAGGTTAPGDLPDINSLAITNSAVPLGSLGTQGRLTRIEGGSDVGSGGTGAGGATTNAPHGFMFGHNQLSLLGSARYIGFNLRHTRANVTGAGTRIGNAPVSIRMKYSFCPQSPTPPAATGVATDEASGSKAITMITHVCRERQMLIKNGMILVSDN